MGKSDSKVLPYVSSDFGIALTTYYDVIVRGNGMFDPDAALGGHQPLGFDQYMMLYQKYYVKSSTISVDVNTTSIGLNNSQIQPCGNVYVWADKLALTSKVSQSDTFEKCMAFGGKVMRLGSAYEKFHPMKLVQYTKPLLSKGLDVDTSGDVSSDPANLWYWHLIVWSNDPMVARTIDVLWSVSYDAVFYEAKNISSS